MAADEYTKAIQLNPKNAGLQSFHLDLAQRTNAYLSTVFYGNRSAAMVYLKDYRSAINDANIASQIDENYQKAYFRMGSAYYKQGRFQKAYESYLIALQKLDMTDTKNYAICLKKIKMCKTQIDSTSKHKMKKIEQDSISDIVDVHCKNI